MHIMQIAFDICLDLDMEKDQQGWFDDVHEYDWPTVIDITTYERAEIVMEYLVNSRDALLTVSALRWQTSRGSEHLI